MPKVLIVDDAAFMRMTLKDILTKAGYKTIDEAANGAEAVSLYKKSPYDLIIMDIVMPQMDGLIALKKIIDLDPQAKIIMCSAMGQQSMVVDSIQAGAKDFIVKPFKPERIVEAVGKIVKA